MGLVEEAREAALSLHGSQKYGEQPYEFHLAMVDAVLLEFGHTSVIVRAAAWLHDVIEDTAATKGDLLRKFPVFVVKIVAAVTRSEGSSRHDLNYYRGIADIPEAVIVKLADRIANTRYSVDVPNPRKLTKYQREYPAFRAVLYSPDEPSVAAMWEELDRLADVRIG